MVDTGVTRTDPAGEVQPSSPLPPARLRPVPSGRRPEAEWGGRAVVPAGERLPERIARTAEPRAQREVADAEFVPLDPLGRALDALVDRDATEPPASAREAVSDYVSFDVDPALLVPHRLEAAAADLSAALEACDPRDATARRARFLLRGTLRDLAALRRAQNGLLGG